MRDMEKNVCRVNKNERKEGKWLLVRNGKGLRTKKLKMGGDDLRGNKQFAKHTCTPADFI